MSFNYNKVENSALYSKWTGFFRVLCKVLFNIKIQGIDKIPDGNFILSINHMSQIDFIFTSITKKLPPLHFMGMSELFRKPVQASFLMSMNAFPVERGEGKSKVAIDYAVKMLKEGYTFAIFPEGKINREYPYNPKQAKSGVAIIAMESGADVLPCAIYCKGKLRPFKKIIVSYGDVIKSQDIFYEYEKSKSYRQTAEFIFSKTKELWGLNA